MSLSRQNSYRMPKLNTRSNSLAYTFLDVCETIQQFLSSIRKDAYKKNRFLFFSLTVYFY